MLTWGSPCKTSQLAKKVTKQKFELEKQVAKSIYQSHGNPILLLPDHIFYIIYTISNENKLISILPQPMFWRNLETWKRKKKSGDVTFGRDIKSADEREKMPELIGRGNSRKPRQQRTCLPTKPFAIQGPQNPFKVAQNLQYSNNFKAKIMKVSVGLLLLAAFLMHPPDPFNWIHRSLDLRDELTTVQPGKLSKLHPQWTDHQMSFAFGP